MAKKKINEYERFMALTDAEKDAEVAKYDLPMLPGRDGLIGKPHRASDRTLHKKAAAKMGRPKIGKGAQIVPISIERGLLKQVNAFARSHKLKRSQMIAEGLRLVMSRAKAG